MKQHPIPQNILDIEFKLFSHFTIKEFAYIAIGMGFGIIFLYMMSTNTIPGWIAIPIFIVSSGIGAFLGLVPINDQKADVYLKNFIKSITSPTLRVWKSKYLDHNIFQRGDTTALSDAKNEQAVRQKPEIIGAISVQKEKTDLSEETIDIEESQKKLQLNRIAQETELTNYPQTSVQQKIVVPTTNTNQPMSANSQSQTKVTQIKDSQNASNNTKVPSKIKVPDEILINNANINKFKATFSLLSPPPNSINISLRDTNNYGIQKAVVIIKDNNDKIMQVKVSDNRGEIITERFYEHGIYKIDIQHSDYIFPKAIYAFNSGTDMPIKIIGVKK